MSKYCDICGKEISENETRCISCSEKNTVQLKNNGKMGIAEYFGLILLYSIPGVGLIATGIMSFVCKNENRKNFARAWLIWLLIGLLVSAFTFFLSMSAMEFLLNQLKNANIADMIKQYIP